MTAPILWLRSDRDRPFELEARRDLAERFRFWLVVLPPDSVSRPYFERAHRALLRSIREEG